mgnify:FL=1
MTRSATAEPRSKSELRRLTSTPKNYTVSTSRNKSHRRCLDLVLDVLPVTSLDLEDVKAARLDAGPPVGAARTEERGHSFRLERLGSRPGRDDAESSGEEESMGDTGFENADADFRRGGSEVLAQHVLERVVRNCFHKWSATQYYPQPSREVRTAAHEEPIVSVESTGREIGRAHV